MVRFFDQITSHNLPNYQPHPSPFRRESNGIPAIVKKCVSEVERRGMTEVGIYRVSGVSSEIQQLKASFETGKKGLF